MAGVDLSTRGYRGRVVVALRGELDIAGAAGTAAALAALAAREGEIIIDLAGLEFIDCSGLAALAGVRRKARQAGGDVVLAAPQPQLQRILAAAGLIHVFSMHASVREAARDCGPTAGTLGPPGRDLPGRDLPGRVALELARPHRGRPGQILRAAIGEPDPGGVAVVAVPRSSRRAQSPRPGW
jgi:anti-sigma B factor antagonist